jgi:hypothetical protein
MLITNRLGMSRPAVFATFWMQTMLPLRLVAIASNVAFAGYGWLAASSRC